MARGIDAVHQFGQSVATMNYRHAFHAGNHGDVLKHAVLARVLSYLTQKDKPLALLDAHAGIGTYDLTGVEAFKTGEWRDGIGRLLAQPLPDDAAALLSPYLALVQNMNSGSAGVGGLRSYPGSPAIARALLREADRILLNELHPQDHALLAARMGADPRVRVSCVDALQAVKAELPFRERRGVVLIDPAFEVAHETEKVARMVLQALARMRAVCMLVWYPVTTREFADTLCAGVAASGLPGILQAELMVREPGEHAGLAGSGMLILNPPWTLHDELAVLLPVLAQRLGKGSSGRASLNWLTPQA